MEMNKITIKITNHFLKIMISEQTDWFNSVRQLSKNLFE